MSSAIYKRILWSPSPSTWVSFFLAASLFTLPISSTAKSIFIVIALVLILILPEYRTDLRRVMSYFWCKAAVALFIISVIACAWSPATLREQIMEISKYSKLLYLPILAVGFRDARARRLSMHGFLLAMFITACSSLLMYAGCLKFNDVEAGGIFRNHIMTGYMMAFAAYLSALLFIKNTHKIRVVYLLLAVFFSFHVLFINNGRTGYVIYLLLMILLMIQSFSWRQALLGIILGLAGVTLAFYESPVMHTAINSAITECKNYNKNDKDTSIGYRLQFHNYANRLFQRHPWFGNGTASFTYLYNKENPIPTRGTHLLEPHSQYWLVASEFGILGSLALVVFFTSLFVASLKLKTLRPVAIAVLLPFIAGNASDSLLFYSGTGYFFILFMALCFGEQEGKMRKKHV